MGKWNNSYNNIRRYRTEWETEYPWLSWDGSSCYCKFCKCYLSNMRKSAFEGHEKAIKHRKNISFSSAKNQQKGNNNEETSIKSKVYWIKIDPECRSNIQTLEKVLSKHSNDTKLQIDSSDKKAQTHRREVMIWGNEVILKLLELVKENFSYLQLKNSKQKLIWKQISETLQDSFQDDDITPERVARKWRNLLMHFKEFKENCENGCASGMKAPIFKREIEEIVGCATPNMKLEEDDISVTVENMCSKMIPVTNHLSIQTSVPTSNHASITISEAEVSEDVVSPALMERDETTRGSREEAPNETLLTLISELLNEVKYMNNIQQAHNALIIDSLKQVIDKQENFYKELLTTLQSRNVREKEPEAVDEMSIKKKNTDS